MNRMLKSLLLQGAWGLLAFALATGAAHAEALSLKVDAAVRRQMKDQKIPGLSLAVVRNGTIMKSAGYGTADLELRVPVRAQTIFEAGSITKQFKASAVMLLVEQ